MFSFHLFLILFVFSGLCVRQSGAKYCILNAITETTDKEANNSLLYNAKFLHMCPFLSYIPVFHFSCRLYSVAANKDRA